MDIVVDKCINTMNRVVQAAKRDGRSGGSRKVRDDDVDIVIVSSLFLLPSKPR